MPTCDTLEKEIAEMESRLFQVKVTMEVEKDNWQRANKLKKCGTHWRNAKTKTQETPEVIDSISTKSGFMQHTPQPNKMKSIHAILKKSTDKWTVLDVATWMQHLNMPRLVEIVNEHSITGAQLLAAHLELSDANLRALFRLQHGDTQWKRFIAEFDIVYRQHAQRARSQQVEHETQVPKQKLPSLVSPHNKSNPKRTRIVRLHATATCWTCKQTIARDDPRRIATSDGKSFCSTECHARADIGFQIGQSNESLKTPRTPLITSRRKRTSGHKGTAAFAQPTELKRAIYRHDTQPQLEQLCTAQSLAPLSPVHTIESTKSTKPTRAKPQAVKGRTQPKPPTLSMESLCVSNAAFNQLTTRQSTNAWRYHMEATRKATFLSTFFNPQEKPNEILLSVLASFLRVFAWSQLGIASRQLHQAFHVESIWQHFLERKWNHSAVAELEYAKKRSWKKTFKTLTNRVNRTALENVKLLTNSESWQLAESDGKYDIIELVVGNQGELVAVITSNQLVQTLVPEVTTMGVLQGLQNSLYNQYTCQRLKLCQLTASFPLDDSWSILIGLKLFNISQERMDSNKLVDGVLHATTRKMRLKCREILHQHIRRAKQLKEYSAIEGLELILAKS